MELSPKQEALLRKLALGKVRITDPGVCEEIGHLTWEDVHAYADRVKARAEAQRARFEALACAMDESSALMRKHGVETMGELRGLGIAIPIEEVAERLIRAHREGEMTDEELRVLGIGHDADGELVLALSPLATLTPAGEG